ncbi:hypothetical protein [Candidatus Parabeggiatoa sp. HSG14]|uniref:hypothetical protein n=1 Tax=Candidatus Parabeggiatoa sp. HSG14 TaxID=3055593 RepID=UPI0025A7A78D|nr:hypothetical protein [Thiotrichales bacterium HSG14]
MKVLKCDINNQNISFYRRYHQQNTKPRKYGTLDSDAFAALKYGTERAIFRKIIYRSNLPGFGNLAGFVKSFT